MRANLFLSVDTRDTRTIAIASSMSGEGKSSIASQLAISMAKASGQTVLLVDGDLRCPDLHDIFGLDPKPGLCGVLSGEAELREAVDTSLGNLVHVLPAGQLNQSPHRLMNPTSVQRFLDEALPRLLARGVRHRTGARRRRDPGSGLRSRCDVALRDAGCQPHGLREQDGAPAQRGRSERDWNRVQRGFGEQVRPSLWRLPVLLAERESLTITRIPSPWH